MLEGCANDALHARSGVQVFLDRDLLGRPLVRDPSTIHVQALGILAEDLEMDGANVPEGAQRRVQRHAGTEVDVEVQPEA